MRICEPGKCAGCCLCMNICPQRCISMGYDEYGELSPVINEAKCTRCGICQNRCIANNDILYHTPLKVFAGWSLSEEDRKSSSSGGAASVFGAKTIEDGGCVYGAAFGEGLRLKHTCALTHEQLRGFKGSKYFQSDINGSYMSVRENLLAGRKVLFVGTPCQIWGLKSYLNGNTEGLVTVDFVCHGVPSQKYIDEYIEHLKPSLKGSPGRISFRQSQRFIFELFCDNGLLYSKELENDLFLNGFFYGIYNRDSCYGCSFARFERVSDITIGDFWGLGKRIPFHHSAAGGVSLIMANTAEGLRFVESCKNRLFLEERPAAEAVEGNSQLSEPVRITKERTDFRSDYKKRGFVRAAKRYVYEKKRRNSALDKIAFVKRTVKKLVPFLNG